MPYFFHYQRTSVSHGTSQLNTQHRYNDFVWLRGQISTEFPGFIIPPLPEKTIMGTNIVKFHAF